MKILFAISYDHNYTFIDRMEEKIKHSFLINNRGLKLRFYKLKV